MISYSVFLESEVAEMLLRLNPKDRQRLLKAFQQLRTNPFVEGDYVERDNIGRLIQVLLVGRHAVVFWPDHAVKEVKILDLKLAGT